MPLKKERFAVQIWISSIQYKGQFSIQANSVRCSYYRKHLRPRLFFPSASPRFSVLEVTRAQFSAPPP